MIRNMTRVLIIVLVLFFFVHLDANAVDIRCTSKEVQLPYPGMLSNHPFYLLKKIRDKILEQFITEPNKRMEYYLFESKKFFNETLIQLHDERSERALDMGKRSNNFLTLFISLYGQTAANGKPISKNFICDFYSIIELQIQKYDEIIATAQDGELKKQLIQLVEQLKQNKEGFDNLLISMNSKRIIYE